MADKPGFHIEIIPNMYDLGLFRKVLLTRMRLRVTTLIAVGILCGIFGGIGYFLRYISPWFWLNVLLIVLAYICVLVVSLLLAFTIGDVVFRGPWREKMARGKDFVPEKIEDQAALLKNKSIYFILIWGLSIIALGLGCDLVTGGNVRWYQQIGSSIVMMKSDDPQDRVTLLRSLSKLYYSYLWPQEDVREAVIARLEDTDPEARALAAYICGKGRYLDAVDGLTALLRNPEMDEHSRSEAAIALGRMEWKSARASLISTLRDTYSRQPDSHELIPSIFYAFYEMKDSAATHDAIQLLDNCLVQRNCSQETYQYGFFYLKSMKVAETSDLSFKYIESDLPLEQKCYAIDSLRFASSKKDIPWMKSAFEQTPSDLSCDVVYRKYHEEAAIVLFEKDPVRALYLRAVGNYMDPANYDWIWMAGSNESENQMTRKVAEIYTRAMIDRGLLK